MRQKLVAHGYPTIPSSPISKRRRASLERTETLKSRWASRMTLYSRRRKRFRHQRPCTWGTTANLPHVVVASQPSASWAPPPVAQSDLIALDQLVDGIDATVAILTSNSCHRIHPFSMTQWKSRSTWSFYSGRSINCMRTRSSNWCALMRSNALNK